MDFLRLDAPRNDNFPTLAIFSRYEHRDRFSSGHRLVRMIVVTNPNDFVIRYAKVDCGDGTTATAFQFAQPLM